MPRGPVVTREARGGRGRELIWEIPVEERRSTMRRIRRVWKALLVFFAAAMIPLALMGCGEGDTQPSGEQPSKTEPASEEHPSASEHPSKEQPTEEHPTTSEHPAKKQPTTSEHPAGEHPK